MCGIFGYVGKRNQAAQLIIEALKRLEYRGYDSWGIAVKNKGRLVVDKHAGKIGSAVTILPKSNFGLGHTRWATHGGVTDKNAHPHLDCNGRIAVVHNGIIENYQELKQKLAKSHRYVSETDTELFAHLVEEYKRRYPFVEAVRHAFLDLRGLSAFVIADEEESTLVAVKTGSPLVVGVGNDENAIGSDAYSVFPISRNVCFLEDGKMVSIRKDGAELFDVKSGKKIPLKTKIIDWKEIIPTRGNFPHFMLKEVHEQPRVLRNILINFDERIEYFVREIRKAKKVYFVGCGSAHHGAMIGSYLFAKISGIEIIPVPGSEFAWKEKLIDKDSLTVFLSQSGETIDVVEPLKILKEEKLKTAALVNVFGSTLYRLADQKIWLEAGQEICVLTTKAFTAKLAIFLLSSYGAQGNLDKGKKLLTLAIKECARLLTKQYYRKIERLIDKLYYKEHIYVIGRGVSFPVGLEAALKIKEVSYIHTEGFAAGELKHGVIALIEKGSPCIVFAPKDETYDAMISSAMEVKARGGYIVGVSHKNNEVFDYFFDVADCGEATVIPNSVIGQLLGYCAGVKRGLDPDQPRNLAKSVTVK